MGSPASVEQRQSSGGGRPGEHAPRQRSRPAGDAFRSGPSMDPWTAAPELETLHSPEHAPRRTTPAPSGWWTDIAGSAAGAALAGSTRASDRATRALPRPGNLLNGSGRTGHPRAGPARERGGHGGVVAKAIINSSTPCTACSLRGSAAPNSPSSGCSRRSPPRAHRTPAIGSRQGYGRWSSPSERRSRRHRLARVRSHPDTDLPPTAPHRTTPPLAPVSVANSGLGAELPHLPEWQPTRRGLRIQNRLSATAPTGMPTRARPVGVTVAGMTPSVP